MSRRKSAGHPVVAQILRVIIDGGITRVGYVDHKNRYHSGVLVSERAYLRLRRADAAKRLRGKR